MVLGRAEQAPWGNARAARATQALSPEPEHAHCPGWGKTWISSGKLQDVDVAERLWLSSLMWFRRKPSALVVILQD